MIGQGRVALSSPAPYKYQGRTRKKNEKKMEGEQHFDKKRKKKDEEN
jgi:hypothetical protein